MSKRGPLTKNEILQAAPLFDSRRCLAEHLGVNPSTLSKYIKALDITDLPIQPNPKRRERSWNEGLTKKTSATLERIGKQRTGKVPTVATRKKMSQSALRRRCGGMTDKSHSEETKQKLREATIRQLKHGLVKQTETKPHVAVRRFLTNDLGISCQEEVRIGVFTVDFLVGDLVIEVNGDYWHSNPKFYPDGPKTKGQKVNHLRDIKKHDVLAKSGKRLVIVWEDEVNDGSYKDKIRQAFNSHDSVDQTTRNAAGHRPGDEFEGA